MRKSKFTESQIVAILAAGDSSLAVRDVCRRNGIRNATYYQSKSKYAGVSANELKRIKDLEAENGKLKCKCPELALENTAIKVFSAKVVAPAEKIAAVMLMAQDHQISKA